MKLYFSNLNFRLNDNESHYTCSTANTLYPTCKTRQFEDGVIRDSTVDKWGFCNEDCNGEKTDPESKYNLAKNVYGNIWTENFFDLRTFGSGYCYTYNPPQMSSVKFQDRLFMLLGNRNTQTDSEELFIGFVIYLHEKGQFWPRHGMDMIGQSNAITLEKYQETVGHFSMTEVENINKPDNPCTEVTDYSFTACLYDYVQTVTNCTIDWSNGTTDPSLCPLDFNLQEYHNILYDLFQLRSLKKIIKTTGCLPKCKYTKYEYEEQANEKVNWKTEWISSFYIGTKYTSYESVVEYYVFGAEDLLADFGSYLGLFLGWSLLSISRDVQDWIIGFLDFFTKIFKKEN